MPQHHDGTPYQGGWIGEVLTGNVRSTSVHGFEHGIFVADIGSRNHAETADESGAEITEDVTEEVGRNNALVVLRPDDELHAHIVYDAIIEFDLRVFCRNLFADPKKHPGCHLEDVGLVGQGHFVQAMASRILEAESDNAFGAATRYPRRRIGNLESLVIGLDPGIQPFRVFSEDDQVHILEGRPDSRQGLWRANIRVEIELLPKLDIDALEAFSDRRGHRTL